MAVPTLAAQQTWYTQGGTSVNKATITQVDFKDTYTPTDTVVSSWDASAAKDGGIMCYVEGTKLTVAGNGSGSIKANADSTKVFNGFNALKRIENAGLLDTSSTTIMHTMFQNCHSLEYVDVSKWDVSKVTTMIGLFNMSGTYNTTLTTLDVSGWKTGSLTNLQMTFSNLHGLTTLDVSKWDVSKVTTMQQTFGGCRSLAELDVSKWNVSNVTNMSKTFIECHALKTLDLFNWNVSKVSNMTDMFVDTFRLEKISVGGNFSFKGNGSASCVLPVPSAGYIDGATGYWYDINKTQFAPAAIPNNTTCTYYASQALVDADANRYVLVKNGTLMRTAAAIRKSKGTQAMLMPSEFASAITG